MSTDLKITIAGNLIVDKIKIIDQYPAPTMLCNILSTGRGIGGCAANTSAALKCLLPGACVEVIGLTGQDEEGEWLKQQLRAFGADVSKLGTTPIAPTSFTDVFTVKSTGQRTFFHSRGANALLGPEQIDLCGLDCGIFHIGYALLLDRMDSADPEYGTVLAKLLSQIQNRGVKTSLDLVSEEGSRFQSIVTPSLPYLNYLIINETEAGLLAGISPRFPDGKPDCESLKQICLRLLSSGVKDLVVIHAPELSCAMDSSGQFYISGSLVLPRDFIKGTVGAGDTFCAAVLACLALEKPIPYLLRAASCAAACNLSEANSTDGLVPLEKAMELEKKFPRIDVSAEK